MYLLIVDLSADIDFTYGPYEWDVAGRGEGIRAVASCSARLNDEMYVFGGQFVQRQVKFFLKPILDYPSL